MQHTCNTHASNTQTTRVTHMQYTCDTQSKHMQHTCKLHAKHMQYEAAKKQLEKKKSTANKKDPKKKNQKKLTSPETKKKKQKKSSVAVINPEDLTPKYVLHDPETHLPRFLNYWCANIPCVLGESIPHEALGYYRKNASKKSGNQQMKLTCNTHATHMQHTCNTQNNLHATRMQHACNAQNLHATHMQHTCNTHATHMQRKTLHATRMQHACNAQNLHATRMQRSTVAKLAQHRFLPGLCRTYTNKALDFCISMNMLPVIFENESGDEVNRVIPFVCAFWCCYSYFREDHTGLESDESQLVRAWCTCSTIIGCVLHATCTCVVVELHVYCMQIACVLPANNLCVACKLHVNYTPIACVLHANHMRITREHRFSSMFC